MTRRDLAWRAGGVLLLGVSIALGVAVKTGANAGLVVVCFALAMAGLVLAVQGRHVSAAWRIERSGHRELPQAIRARRYRSRSGGV